MSYKNFSNTVDSFLKENKSFSLKLLVEEEKEEEKKEEKEDLFGDSSLDDNSESEGGSEGGSEGDDAEGDDAEGDSSVGGDDSEGGARSAEIESVADGIEKMTAYYQKFFGSSNDNPSDESMGIVGVQNNIANQVSLLSASVNESKKYELGKRNSIKAFLNEETDPNDIVKDIEAVDNIIDKGTELINKFKKGSELNITHYVEASINAFRNFDSLFSKESIVKQAAINLIILNSGSKAEANIAEFEELFHEELHKEFGIEYEEHALITKNYHTSTGAVKQG